MSKITVKHFVNSSLKESKKFMENHTFSDENGKKHSMPPPFYPLYIKITFQRATTQMKSLFDVNFVSIKDAEFKAGDYLAIERELITDVITKDYKKYGKNFSLKGIPDKCKPYSQGIKEFFLNKVIMVDFNNYIASTTSPYKNILSWHSADEPASVYYNAAVKLLGEKPELKKLKDKFDMCSQFQQITEKKGIDKTQLFIWKFGDAKEKFRLYAIKSGLTNKYANTIINTMDDLINSI